MIQDIITPLLISVKDNLGIRASPKVVTIALQLASEFRKVIDLSIKDDPDCFLSIGHRLMPPSEVDNREPPKAKPDRSGDEVTFIVGTTVNNAARHPSDRMTEDRAPVFKVKLPANATHSDPLP
jgi:hypothetical protein